MSLRNSIVLLVASLAAPGLLGACSSGSSGTAPASVGYKEVADATRTAGPGRTSGTAEGPTGGKGPVQGAVDGDLTGTGLVNASLFAGTARHDVEIRWKDNNIYVKRAVAPATGTAGIASWTLRPPAQKTWSARPVASQFTADLFAPFAPAALADLLVMRAVPVDVTRDGSKSKLHGTRPLPILGVWTQATVDLWVDDAKRVVRVEISSKAGGGMQYDVTYGGAAPKVDAPPSDSIDHSPAATPKPAGPFTTVSQGNDAGVAWSLQRAPGTQNTDCWRWVANPTVKIVAAEAGYRCVPVADPTDDAATQTQFVASSDGKGKYDVLAVRLPPKTRSVSVTPLGGRPTTTPASGATFVWVRPIADKAGSALITLADGTVLECGPGSISVPKDWASVDDIPRMMALPWVCT